MTQTKKRIETLGYNALDIAKYIIKYEGERGYCISNLKLQKILYFLQAEFLVLIGKSLFNEDLIAWDFGPIVESVYYEYKVYGGAQIASKINDHAYIDKKHRGIINNLLEEIREYSTTQLAHFCHNQTPWKTARVRLNNVINLDELRDFFC